MVTTPSPYGLSYYRAVSTAAYNGPYPSVQSPWLQSQTGLSLSKQAGAYFPGTSPQPNPQTSFSAPTASMPATSSPTTLNPEQLTGKKGIQVGLRNGLIFSAMAAIPIWGIEQLAKDENPVLYTARYNRFPKSWINTLEKPLAQFVSSVSMTALVGVTAGAMLGSWIVSRTGNRIKEINRVRLEKQQGRYQPKPLTLLQKFNLQEKPVTQPEEAYQKLLDKNLNSEHAFKEGALSVLAAKLIPSALTILPGVGLYWGLKRIVPDKVFKKFNERFQLKESALTFVKPVFIAKTLALPLMGGFIAQQTVPWMRQQLGLDKSQG